MAYKPYQQAIANFLSRRDTSRPLAGSKYMEVGKTYDVTVSGLDIEPLVESGWFYISVESEDGKKHKERVPLYWNNKGSLELSYKMRLILEAVFSDPENILKFLRLLSESPTKAMNTLRGAKFKVTIGRSRGYVVEAVNVGTEIKYRVAGSETGRNLLDERLFDEITAAHEAAKAADLYRSWPNLASLELTTGNDEAFLNILKAYDTMTAEQSPAVEETSNGQQHACPAEEVVPNSAPADCVPVNIDERSGRIESTDW